jgi:hypothetical protein
MKKKCSKCLIEKEVYEFHKHKATKDGYYYICKECRRVDTKRKYYESIQREKVLIDSKVCSSCKIEKDINNFHKQIGTKDGFRTECKECRSKDFKDKYNNSDEFSEKHKKRTSDYRVSNLEKNNEYFKRRYINRRYEYAWRGMLKSVLRRIGGKKESSTYETLGYSAQDLKQHMENLFTEGMSWDNWGEWHIDHIKPLTKFNENDNPKEINSLSNLQPLWAIDNIKKSNK